MASFLQFIGALALLSTGIAEAQTKEDLNTIDNFPNFLKDTLEEYRTDFGENDIDSNNDNYDEARKYVQNNIREILEEAFAKAEKIAHAREIENKMSGGKTLRRINAGHGGERKADPSTKELSDCRAMGMIEASKIILQKLKIKTPRVQEAFLDSIEIPQDFRSELENQCFERRSSLNLRQEDHEEEELSMPCSAFERYRSITGRCNNQIHTEWGRSKIPFKRLLHANYSDGVGLPRGGYNLPNPRLISIELSKVPSHGQSKVFTQIIKAWGQFVDHDMVKTPETEVKECCEEGQSKASYVDGCIPIDVTKDQFYSSNNVKCLPFKRSLPAPPCDDCGLTKREQLNQVTAFIDASNVYGSSTRTKNQIRLFEDGKLAYSESSEEGRCSASKSCPYAYLPEYNAVENPDAPFTAGDVRVNEQPGLTSLHTIFMRYHNKIADALKTRNPTYDDETLYQESRRIISALMQQITYAEFLPMLFGPTHFKNTKLAIATKKLGIKNKYSAYLNPSHENVFAAAAFRFGHSWISDSMLGFNNEQIPLSRNFFNSVSLKNNPNMHPSYITWGEANTKAEQIDTNLVTTITNLLFAEGPQYNHGTDLMALNILRGRDHGLPGYNYWYQRCSANGRKFNSFYELRHSGRMESAVVDVFEELYDSVDDIDLYPAGLGEIKLKGSLLGPTFACILQRSFFKLKFGDRFWYENQDGRPGEFTDKQLNVIKRTTFSSIICDVTTNKQLQVYVMVYPVSQNHIFDCSKIQSTFSLLNERYIKYFDNAANL